MVKSHSRRTIQIVGSPMDTKAETKLIITVDYTELCDIIDAMGRGIISMQSQQGAVSFLTRWNNLKEALVDARGSIT